jgi:hypothetical protein
MMHPVGMRRRRSGPLLPAIAVVAAGCASLLPGGGRTDLGGPWLAEPFAVDQSIVATAEQMCRRQSGPVVKADSTLAVVDARGDGRLIIAFAGRTSSALCEIEAGPDGEMHVQGAGGMESTEPLPALGPTEVRTDGVTGSESGPGGSRSSVTGQAGPHVATLVVVTRSGLRIRPSLGRDGWFAAWWPTLEMEVVVEGYDASGALVGRSP